MRFQIAFAFAGLAAVAVYADSITIQVQDASNFCTFLPPTSSANRNIADTEYMAEAFCMGSTPGAHAAGSIESGFIQSAHYVATDDYVQVTGQIDPSKMNLNITDEGGQYDVAMPKGAVCVGWPLFVNLIEPLGHTYCVRCCNSKTFCNRGISEKGCAHIIPGDYSGPWDGTGSALEPATAAASAAATSSAVAVSGTTYTSSGAAASGAAASGASASASASSSNSVTAQSVEKKNSGAAAIHPTFIAIGALLVSMGLLA